MKRTFYHVSPARNTDSIRKIGIMASFSRSANGAIWIVKKSQLLWAIRHVAKRHGQSWADVAVFKVSVDVDKAHKFRKGLWYTFESISPQNIGHFYEVSEGRE